MICGTVKSMQKIKIVKKSKIIMSNNRSLLYEVWDFLKVRKAWWLTPIIVMLLLISVLIIFSQSSSISPFIYALF